MDDETKGTEPTTDAAPVTDDGAAAPPNYADLDNKRLIANMEKANKSIEALKAKPPTKETLAEVVALNATRLEIKAEMDRRYTEQQDVLAKLNEISATDVTLPDFEALTTIGDGMDETAPAAGDAPAEREGELVAAGASAPGAAQMAAARGAQASGVQQASGTPRVQHRSPWLASAGLEGVRENTEFDPMVLGEQITRAMKMRGAGKVFLASMPGFGTSGPLGETLGEHNGRETNNRLIREAVQALAYRNAHGREAHDPMLAAICDPLDIIRDIPNPGRSQAEPFSDTLPFRGAGHLGFQFTRAVTIASVTGGLSLWSDADQALVTDEDDTWKPVYDVTCGTPVSTRATELTWGLRYEESTDLSSPERVADVLNALETARARRREAYLLRRWDQLASGYTWVTPDVDGTTDLIELIGRLLEKFKYTERLDLQGAHVYLPPGLLTKIKLDKARRGFDAMPEGDVLNEIKRALPEPLTFVELRDISDNRSDAVDGAAATSIAAETAQGGPDDTLTVPGAAPTALVHDQCQDFRIRIGWPSAFIAYSTGRQDFGVMRSPELIRQNRSIQFGREWLGINKHGAEPSAYATVTYMGLGRRTGTMDLSAETCAS